MRLSLPNALEKNNALLVPVLSGALMMRVTSFAKGRFREAFVTVG